MLRLGIDHAERALKIDPRNHKALDLRGTLRYWLREETKDTIEVAPLLADAEADLLAAVDANPRLAHAWDMLARVWAAAGRHAEAKKAANRALDADEFYEERENVYVRQCVTSLNLKEWNEVTNWCEKGYEEFPENDRFINAELVALAGPEGPAPDVEKAWRLHRAFLQFSPEHKRADRIAGGLLHVAAVLVRAGLPDSARAVIAQARAAELKPDKWNDYLEANVRLQLGEPEAAISLLGRFLDASPAQRDFIAGEWWWEGLHDHPAWHNLMAR